MYSHAEPHCRQLEMAKKNKYQEYFGKRTQMYLNTRLDFPQELSLSLAKAIETCPDSKKSEMIVTLSARATYLATFMSYTHLPFLIFPCI